MSLEALKALVRREGLTTLTDNRIKSNGHSAPNSPIAAAIAPSSSSSGGNNSEDQDNSNNNDSDNVDNCLLCFDHARCTDCSYGFSMASDCINHLAALQKQALNASERLQELVEMRERMLEASEAFRLSQFEDGHGNGSNRDSNGHQQHEVKES